MFNHKITTKHRVLNSINRIQSALEGQSLHSTKIVSIPMGKSDVHRAQFDYSAKRKINKWIKKTLTHSFVGSVSLAEERYAKCQQMNTAWQAQSRVRKPIRNDAAVAICKCAASLFVGVVWDLIYTCICISNAVFTQLNRKLCHFHGIVKLSERKTNCVVYYSIWRRWHWYRQAAVQRMNLDTRQPSDQRADETRVIE